MDIREIKPYLKNAKKHPNKQIKQIANSIMEFGFNQPIVIDKNNEIIVGHGRYEAAKLLKFEDVPVLQVDLTDEQANAYRLADNKLNESEWDMGLVIEELKGLSLEMLDLTGFDRDLIVEPDEKDDQIPENVPPVAKLGDIWQLGRHRVMCGDSTKLNEVERLMDGKKADLFTTDPPYGVSYGDKNVFLNAIGRPNAIQENIKNDTKTIDEMSELWVSSFSSAIENCKGGASYYVFSPQGGELMMMMMMALLKSGWLLKHSIIWVKNNFVIGRSDYHYKHEHILYGWKDGGHQFYGGKGENSVWEFNKPQKSNLHPTTKPVEILVKIISNSSKEEDIILDLFLGSGSTLIACEKTNRICYGMELDPKYVDVIIKRWEDYTNQRAVCLTK